MAENTKWSQIDPKVYIPATFFDPDFVKLRKYILQNYHHFFSKLAPVHASSLKVLEIGSGPTIAFQISAAQHDVEIVLSEYSDSFRLCLRQWVDEEPTAPDWTMYFQYVVVDLEGKGEEEIQERVTHLRRAIKSVVACDILKSPPLPHEFMQEYDVVTSTLCLEAACQSLEEYRAAIAKMYRLVKPGGHVVILSPELGDKVHTAEGVDVSLGRQGV